MARWSRSRLLTAVAVGVALGLASGEAAAQYTPRDAAEESCRRVQQVKTPESEPQHALAPYEFGFSGSMPLAGESIDMTVEWGDGSPVGRLQESGPTIPGDPDGGISHIYTQAGTYTWRSSGSRVMLLPISPSEGNLPCTVPIAATGTIVVTVPASAPPRAAPGGATAGSPAEPAAPAAASVAAGRVQAAGDRSGGGSSPLLMVLLGAVGLGAAGVLVGRRSGWLGGPTARTDQLKRVTPGGVAGEAAEYVQNVHGEVSGTKQAHDAEMARRREELVQQYLPTVGHQRGLAEDLADAELSQYGTNAPMVNDVAKDVLWDAPTKGVRDAWAGLSRFWNTTFGPRKP